MEIELLANPITEEADVSAPEKTPSPKKANVEPVMACKDTKKSRISCRRSTIAVSFEDLAETSLEKPKESPQTKNKAEPAVSKHHSKAKASSMEIEAPSVEKAKADRPAADGKKSRISRRRSCVTVSREEFLGTLKEKPTDVPLVDKAKRRSTVAVSHEEFSEACSMEPKEAPTVGKAKRKVEPAASNKNQAKAKEKESTSKRKEAPKTQPSAASIKKSRISQRRSTVAVSREQFADACEEEEKEAPSVDKNKDKVETKTKAISNKNQAKSKASSVEKDSFSKPKEAPKAEPEVAKKKSRISQRRSTVAVSREQFDDACEAEDKAKDKVEPAVVPSSKENEPPAKPKEKSPPKKESNARLRSRAISCYYEKPQDEADLATSIVSAMDMKQVRGPEVIEAPSLPKNRGKLRGVSAVPKAKILDHQRFLDYQAEMNAKWKEKPKAKKPVDVETKEKRREALKKLTEKKPAEGEQAPGSSKRKATTTVPKVANSNRGAFLTEGINGLPPSKVAKLDAPEPPLKNRRATIDSETFSQQIKAPDSLPLPRRNWRPPERNRVTFARMEKDMEEKLRLQKMSKRVRFNDKPVIHLVEKYIGQRPMHGVNGRKDTELLFFSTYAERRERWSSLQVNDKTSHFETILKWANQWLKLRSVDAVADSDVLKPIAAEFENVKQYKENFVPLMKLELLTTIERDYKLGRPSYEVCLQQPVEVTKSFYCLTTRVFINPPAKFMLYTLSSGDKLPETFATLREQRTKNGQQLIFEILKDGISLETFNGIKLLTARPVVDSLRVDLGALRAVDQLARSPLHRRIIKPTEMLKNASIPSYGTPFVFKGFAKLNPHQELVCASTYQRVIDDSKPSITLIQGPPGTGKSMIIANISFQCLYGKAAIKKDRKILICAHSNTAVDSIVSRLHQVRENFSEKDRFEMLRYGLHEKMSSLSRHYSLEHKYQCVRNHRRDLISAGNRAILKQCYIELKAEVNKLRNTHLNGTWLFDQYQDKVRKLQIYEEKLNPRLTLREEFDIAATHIKAANIVCTTLSSCVKLSSYINYFDVCLIDEATQCTEPWTLLPMRFGIPHLVLVGDTQQLPAVVLSQRAVEFGLARSMFDRIQRSLERQQADDPFGHLSVHTKLFKLTTQYRMHPEICKWPNRYFYDAQLVNEVGLEGKLATPLIPYAIINLGYTRDTSDPKTRSISNEEEARFVAKLLAEMEKHLPSRRYGYGLISPYSSQCYALSQVLPSHMRLPPPLTVDAYQGTESDVVVISNARTQGSGFLSNYQRLNVAVTRPKRCLIICGNFRDLLNVPMWRDLLDDAGKRGVYFDLKREDVANLKESLMSKLLVKPPENEE
ncbi:probable helicase senataxin isoform X2 [Drosophila subobscura]|uniref:probable helicase senataxin isoform X2 n=1 Tax=Drosophila subobscura TaxID=7241 RepID=UPI00155A3352|nr:probable helicase senataxin isoform X2 [Drosophila subobscura]